MHNDNPAARWLAIAALAMAMPMAAAAQQAFTRNAVNLRAGPSPNYPLIAALPPGQVLNVVGCTSGYGWCDVVLPDGLRGWTAAQYLSYTYAGAPVPLASYGAMIGVPIIAFSIGSYWGSHYRDRPWYGDPRWWGSRPLPPPVPGWRPPPPPVVGWQPRPPAPGWHPPPPRPGYGPPPGYRPPPPPGYRPPPPPGYRPPPGHRPPPPPGGGGNPGHGGPSPRP